MYIPPCLTSAKYGSLPKYIGRKGWALSITKNQRYDTNATTTWTRTITTTRSMRHNATQRETTRNNTKQQYTVIATRRGGRWQADDDERTTKKKTMTAHQPKTKAKTRTRSTTRRKEKQQYNVIAMTTVRQWQQQEQLRKTTIQTTNTTWTSHCRRITSPGCWCRGCCCCWNSFVHLSSRNIPKESWTTTTSSHNHNNNGTRNHTATNKMRIIIKISFCISRD